MIIVGIDVGYTNLGLVSVQVDKEYNIIPTFVKRINLRNVRCHCLDVPHTNEVGDLVAHFIHVYQHLFDEADVILVERQPPGGLTNIESLLFYIFRNKIVLISPNSLQKHFGINFYEYERRKVEIEKLATPYLDTFQSFTGQVRKHDMADALCLILFYVADDKKRYLLKKNKKVSINSFQEFLYQG